MKKKFGFERLAQQFSERIYEDIVSEEMWAKGDSPIEKLLFAAIIRFHEYEHKNGLVIGAFPSTDEDIIGWIERQVKVADARVDFLLTVRGNPNKLVIECDGHEFHERTKEQAAKDRSRDRAFQAAGHTVFRFTGSEIWRDPMGCAQQVSQWIVRAYQKTFEGQE